MAILTAEKISKSYTEKKLLNEVSLFLNENDKIGVIGLNGAGKSTLLKILAGKEIPDQGKISQSNGIRIAYLDQNPIIEENLSALEIVFKYSDSQTRSNMEHEAKIILSKMGFTDFDSKVKMLSGGEKKRLAIARILINSSDILILDEPTNHLDSQMILWLEIYLQRYRGILVMVTHDRYFLDRVVNKMVEIDNGNLFLYEANYSRFLELKEQRETIEIGNRKKERNFFKRELEWIRRGPKARSTKSKARINTFEGLSTGKIIATEKLEMDSVSTRLGNKTIEINNISKSFGTRVIIKQFTHMIMRNARIGIIGKNGSGKSTLVKIITKEIEPDIGSVVHGETVKIGYISQEFDAQPDKMRVIDYIKEVAEQVVTNDGIISASKMLERFLFDSSLQWSPISKLSGGEKRRLNLLRVLMGAPNILFLDEPTNDLDIETLTVLEDYLERFNGAVITISHDRYFLDKIVDTIFEFDDSGELNPYNGGYSDYLIQKEQENENAVAVKRTKNSEKNKQNKLSKFKFSFNEQREFEVIDIEIATFENQLKQLKEEIILNASDYEQLIILQQKKDKLEETLSLKMERWIYLNDLSEQINLTN